MYQQKQKELLKQYEKQEKKLKELKAGGKSTKQAVSTWGLPVMRWSSQEDELAGRHQPAFQGLLRRCGFLSFPFLCRKSKQRKP